MTVGARTFSTTQPAHISSPTSCAGVATAAGMVAKYVNYLAIVEKAGGDVIPLVVEGFGVWTTLALSVLNFISDRTTTRSGLSPKMARRNLLQQLSVCLWVNNARMILRHQAQHGSDDDFLLSL